MSSKYDIYHEEWIRLYNSGYTIEDIAKQYSCSVATVYYVLNEAGCVRSKIDADKNKYQRRYGKYDTYFDSIDSEGPVYYLGLILADGCIYTPSKSLYNQQLRLQLKLSEVDGYMVEGLAKILNRRCIYIKESFRNGSRSLPSYQVGAVSDYLCNRLIEYGITPRKSLDDHESIIFSHIPDNLMRHFVRGIIDGDGYVLISQGRYGCIGVCGNHNDMKSIANVFSNIGCCTRSPIVRDSRYSRVNWTSRADVTRIISYLYDDATIYLTRKYDKAMDILELYDRREAAAS
jgi:intein-encoded DNA endonuclease-like protein